MEAMDFLRILVIIFVVIILVLSGISYYYTGEYIKKSYETCKSIGYFLANEHHKAFNDIPPIADGYVLCAKLNVVDGFEKYDIKVMRVV